MDKQEYREIAGDIRRAFDRREYDKVLMYADELDMRRVSDGRLMEMVADSHAAEGDLKTARELLLKAYEKTPMGRKIAYKLSELSIQLGDLDGAVDFYEDFCKMAPHDNDRFLLKYKIGKAGRVAKKDLVKVLAAYCAKEVDEKWMAELAAVYDELGDKGKCNEVCDDIILWFADGKYVQKALELKKRNGGLTEAQQRKLEQMRSGEKTAGTARQTPVPEPAFPAYETLEGERDLHPGTMEPELLTDEDLDSILEEYITIEDATAPPKPVEVEVMAEAFTDGDEEISFVDIAEPETEVIPVEQIREAAQAAGEAFADIEEAKAEAKKAAAIEAATAGDVFEESELEELIAEMPEEIQNEPVIEEIELKTAPVHAEVREWIVENMDQSEPDVVPDIIGEPASEETGAADAPAEREPLFKTAAPSGKPFSNIEAMQSARTAPPKDEASFWKIPDELTMEEEAGAEEFTEPVYGSHRWFEENTEPDFEEPVFGVHRFATQPEPEPDEEYGSDVVVEQVEPEPIAIEPAEEDDLIPERFSTIRTTSSGAELMGLYAAAKSAGTAEHLSEQAAFVRKPVLGGKKTLPPEMFADPTTEPEYYEGPVYFEEPEAGPQAEETAEPEDFETNDTEPEAVWEKPEEAAEPEQAFCEMEEEYEMDAEKDSEAERNSAAEVEEWMAAAELEEAGIDEAGSQLMQELFAEDSSEEELPDEEPEEVSAEAPETVFLKDVTEEAETEEIMPEEPAPGAIESEGAGAEEMEPGEPVPQEMEPELMEPGKTEPEEAGAEEAAPEEPEGIPDLAEQVAAVMEEDRPSPFLVRVMPHESIEEVVPDIIREREVKKAEAEPAAEPELPDAPAHLPEQELKEYEKEAPGEPEAEPSVYIPLNQLAKEEGKVITPVTEKSITAAEGAEPESFAPVFDASLYGDLFEAPAEDEAVSEFEGAVQEFELSRGTESGADWAEEYEAAEPQVDEAPIVEITTPIPPVDEPEEAIAEAIAMQPEFEPEAEVAAEEAAEAALQPESGIPAETVEETAEPEPTGAAEETEEYAAEPEAEEATEEAAEPEPELSDFEKAMRAFEAGSQAVSEEDFVPEELDAAMDEFMDEEIEPWTEPEFGMPDFAESEFAKPAYLGNAFKENDDYAAEERMAEAEEKEAEELSGFEKALREFERENRERAIEPLMEEPEFEEEEPVVFEEEEEPLAQQPPKYSIPEDLKGELAEFLLIDGMENRICNTIGNIIERKRGGDPTGGHLIVTGDAKSGKTYLTISIIKAVGKEIGSSTGRVAKVQADALNGKDLNKVFGKIAGSDLIIENAGYLNDETVDRLMEAIRTTTSRSMVVLEGNELGVENIIAKHPELTELFHTRLNLNELSLSQWADLACDYAKEKGYVVGDMALLALHARIDEMNLPTTRLVVEDVQGIIDRAIEKAKKRFAGRLFGGKKSRDSSIQELDETDFM